MAADPPFPPVHYPAASRITPTFQIAQSATLSYKAPLCMFVKSINFLLGAAILAALAGGCKKSEPEQKPGGQASPSQPYTNAAPGELLARIHWLGKKRIATDPNAANFMGIWNLPESQKLETQTLDKLALAPWDLPRADTNLSAVIATNASSSALLRPLLDDLLQEESYLEIRQLTNQPPQTVLAIHLDDQRAALWQSNIASLAHSPATNHASLFTNPTITRSAQWTLLGFGDKQNALVADIAARIQAGNTPFPATLTNYWIDAQLDLKRLVTLTFPSTEMSATPAAGTNAGIDWPTNINFTFIGDGQQVVTRADADFAQPLPIELEPWTIPTNLIHDPLIGFSAIRGFRNLLKSCKPWNDLQLGTPPNQAYAWGQHGVPWLHFVAIPSAEASNQVDRLADFAEREVNPKIAATRIGTFEKVPGTQHLKWQGVPVFSPDLNWTNIEGTPYIVAGFFSRSLTNQPPPAELFPQFSGSTNMLWYDWDFTRETLKGWTPIYQLVRHLFNLPRFETDDIGWLMSVAERSGNCVSALKLETSTRLSFTRHSTIGLTSPELPIFLDWLNSPKFPHGLYTFLAPPPPPPAPPTNSVPQPAPQPASQSGTNTPAEPKKP